MLDRDSSLQPSHQSFLVPIKRLNLKDGVLMRKFYFAGGKDFYPQIFLHHKCRTSVTEQLYNGPEGVTLVEKEP